MKKQTEGNETDLTTQKKQDKKQRREYPKKKGLLEEERVMVSAALFMFRITGMKEWMDDGR